MSDVIVIDAFKAVLGGVSLPFVDTLNSRPDSLPSSYISLERDHATVTRITLGTPTMFREEGVLQVVVLSRAGTGDGAAQAAAEEVRDAFHNYAVGHLQILEVSSPSPSEPDDGSYFKLRIPVQYQFDFFKP